MHDHARHRRFSPANSTPKTLTAPAACCRTGSTALLPWRPASWPMSPMPANSGWPSTRARWSKPACACASRWPANTPRSTTTSALHRAPCANLKPASCTRSAASMHDIAMVTLALAALAGCVLGVPVQRAALPARPALWFGPSLLLRIGMVAGGIYLAGAGSSPPASPVSCWLARVAVLRLAPGAAHASWSRPG